MSCSQNEDKSHIHMRVSLHEGHECSHQALEVFSSLSSVSSSSLGVIRQEGGALRNGIDALIQDRPFALPTMWRSQLEGTIYEQEITLLLDVTKENMTE